MNGAIKGSWIGIVLAALVACPRASIAQASDSSAVSPSQELSSDDVASRLESLSEQVQTLQGDTDKLKKFKFSGYIQVRWEHAENQSDSVAVAGNPVTITPANSERFYIRRGRFKLTYDSSPLSQAVIYFDGNTQGATRNVTLLDAYLTLLDPWTVDHRHGITFGQFNVPFGYEIERSSSLRELPERSRAENVLFPGERDRGVKLVDAWTYRFETVVAVLNGGGINNTTFPTTDPTSSKDWVGRIRYAQGHIDGSVSGYWGSETVPLTGPDAQIARTRFGADAQAYYELPTMGGGSLRGEFYTGRNANPTNIKASITAAAPILLVSNGKRLATDFQGGYAMWVQNLGDRLQFAARYDWFDPDDKTGHDQFERWGFGVNAFYDGFTRITVAYDVPITDKLVGTDYQDPHDNLLTLQFQHKW